MRAAIATASLLVFALGSATLSAQDAGTIPTWEVKEISVKIEEQVAAVRQIMQSVRPKEWVQGGANEAYIDQHAALLADLANAELSAQALGRDPEKLTYAVDTFLWLDRVYSTLRSLTAGVRRYQSVAVADLLEAASGRNSGSMADLKEYMRQLAKVAEDRLEIAHDEAQRCRAQLVNAPR